MSLLKQFKTAVDHNNKTGSDPKTSPFYTELNEMLGSRPNVRPVKTASTLVCQKRPIPAELPSENEDIEDIYEEEENNIKTTESEKKKKKRSYNTTSTAIGERIMEHLDEIKRERTTREEEKRKLTEKLHTERMGMFREFLDILKNK